MKFTKEQAVEKLNQVLTNGDKKPLRISARTLETQAENLMGLVGDEEMELDTFVEKVKPMLESMNANAEHDYSEFIKDYKKKNPTPEPPKPEPQKKDPEPDDPNKELKEQLAAITQKLNEREEKEAVAAKRAEIRKYLKDNNVDDDKWIDSILSIATIGKDDDANEKGKTYLELYNQSRSGGYTVPPKSPSAGGGAPDTDAFKEVRDILEAEEKAGQGK